MTFFYDLNKRLDSIRATPEVTNQQLNEQASPLTRILNERATGDYSAVKAAAGKDIGKPGKNFSKIAAGAAKRYGSEEAGKRVAGAVLNKLRHPKEGMGFLGEKDVEEAYNPNSVDAEHRRSLEASHMANLKKKAAAGDESAKKRLQALKDKKEGQSNDFTSRMERESAGMDEGELNELSVNKLLRIKHGANELARDERMSGGNADMAAKAERVAGKASYRAHDKTVADMKAQGMDLRDTTDEGAGVMHFKDQQAKAAGEKTFKLGGKTFPVKEEGGRPRTPVNKIKFADSIVAAKEDVDEMLGQVAAEAMRNALSPKQKGIAKLRGNPNEIDAGDLAALRRGAKPGRNGDMEEASTGNAFDYKNFKQPEKQKPTSFVHKGTYGTEYDGDRDDAKAIRTKKQAAVAAGSKLAGRGRPKKDADPVTGDAMKGDWSEFGDKVKLKPFTGNVTQYKDGKPIDTKESLGSDPKDQGEYDQEGDMAKDTIKTVVRHAQALEKILGDNDNLPEWVQSKLAKIESMMTAVDDYMQNQQDDMDTDDEQEPIAEKAVSKKQQRFMGMVSAAKKGEKPASKEVAKVAKTMKKDDAEDFASTKHKGLPEKAAKKTKEVDETTSSGSISTSGSAAPKSSGGMSYGKGIYDSLNRKLEGMISESMNINMSMNNDDHGGPSRSLTVTATDEDAMALASMLRMAGMGGSNDHMPHMNNGVVQPDNVYDIEFDDGTDDLAAELSNELHGGDHSDDSEVCSTCGSSACGCDNSDTMDEAYGDTDETLNKPDWPTDQEYTSMDQSTDPVNNDLNGDKSTGQTTIPVIASQQDRQHAYEDAVALRRMMEMAGLPVAEAAPSVKLATPQHVDEPVSPASAAAAADKKPAGKPVTKSATPQAVDEPVKPVKEDQMAHSLMRELHNFKY